MLKVYKRVIICLNVKKTVFMGMEKLICKNICLIKYEVKNVIDKIFSPERVLQLWCCKDQFF